MKLTGNKVAFDKSDWGSGRAKEAIAWLKSNKAKYNPVSKQWTIVYDETLRQFKELFMSETYKPKPKKEEPLEFTKFLTDEEVFTPLLIDPDNFNVWELMRLVEVIERFEKLLVRLRNDKASAELIERVENILYKLFDRYKEVIYKNDKKAIL